VQLIVRHINVICIIIISIPINIRITYISKTKFWIKISFTDIKMMVYF